MSSSRSSYLPLLAVATALVGGALAYQWSLSKKDDKQDEEDVAARDTQEPSLSSNLRPPRPPTPTALPGAGGARSASTSVGGSPTISMSPSKYTAEELIGRMQERIQRDEGGRGIAPLVKAAGPGSLFRSVQAACAEGVEHVVIVTGFPCLLEHTPPTETDGPLGAVAMALALIRTGRRVTILTDEANEDVVLSASAALAATTTPALKKEGRLAQNADGRSSSPGPHVILSQLTLESFPGGVDCDEGDLDRLTNIAESCQLLIAIERAGISADGTYRTMRGKDMSAIVAPLDMLFPHREIDGDDHEEHMVSLGIPSIGIGDGGNEVGMGKIYDAITQSAIPNAQQIACTTAADELIVASISNWGGYALAAGIAIYAADRGLIPAEQLVAIPHTSSSRDSDYLSSKISKLQSEQKGPSDTVSPEVRRTLNRHLYLSSCLISADDEANILSRMVAAGAKDGVTGKAELSVDGMPLAKSNQVLEDMRNIALM